MFIEVLYSDLTRKRVPVREADALPKINVLAVILSAPDSDKPRIFIDGQGYRRLDQAIENDYYYLLKYWDDNSWWYTIEGINAGDFPHFHKNSKSPFSDCSLRIEHPRFNCWTLIFEGIRIEDSKWEGALEIFNKNMH